MTGDVVHQKSKEFQLKLKPVPGAGGGSDPASVDAALFDVVKSVLVPCAEAVADQGKPRLDFPKHGWSRNALRFDTAPVSANGLFRQHWLSLAIEATDSRTKLKCKHHSFIPTLIVGKPGNSICYPDPGKAARYKHCGAKLKVEQDIHFNNTKTCVSGSLFLKGRQEAVQDLGFFSRYFPGLVRLAPRGTPLFPVVHWRETVFDSISVDWGATKLDCVMLVNRWNPQTNELLESELAFKVRKATGKSWDREQLHLASRFYAALHNTGVFKPDPPIFYYLDPVASVDVERV